jgi:hypothetical protein
MCGLQDLVLSRFSGLFIRQFGNGCVTTSNSFKRDKRLCPILSLLVTEFVILTCRACLCMFLIRLRKMRSFNILGSKTQSRERTDILLLLPTCCRVCLFMLPARCRSRVLRWVTPIVHLPHYPVLSTYSDRARRRRAGDACLSTCSDRANVLQAVTADL